MNQIHTEPYLEQQRRWPSSGKHILAHYDDYSVVVYQAYRPSIGAFAVRHGYFGGEFRYTRMSWIKPNFLWMMYRSGWGAKPGQEMTLAIRLKREFFDAVLACAVASSFGASHFEDRNAWQQALRASDVRLQWDPDHDPAGRPETRRAIQLGLRGEMLKTFGREAILAIEDMTDFVAAQRQNATGDFSRLQTPAERVYVPANPAIRKRLKLSAGE